MDSWIQSEKKIFTSGDCKLVSETLVMVEMRDTWYQCDRCTVCCKWPGDVKVEDDEIQAIADFVGIEFYTFVRDHTRLRTNRSGLSLLEKENDECYWLEGNSCKLQDVKPRQCKGFPNQWNFPGWKKECQAKPVAMEDAIEHGLVNRELAEGLPEEVQD